MEPRRWAANLEYLYAVDLYNFAYWWEAHEVWEGLWKSTARKSPEADFFQGLIKISAAFLKWHARKERGLIELYHGGVGHLRDVSRACDSFMGIDLVPHIKRLSNHFQIVVTERGKWADPLANYPFIVLAKKMLPETPAQ